MHGLPIEKATEKKLNISGRDQIEQLGVDQFIEECRALALDNLKEMTATFKELGVWMDWDTPYMTISKEFMEGVWW
jgi:isoleucyl-tRNA synthetase